MILEYFLAAILMYGTPAQEILLLDRTPTIRACKAKAQQYQEVAPKGLRFACISSSGRTQNTI